MVIFKEAASVALFLSDRIYASTPKSNWPYTFFPDEATSALLYNSFRTDAQKEWIFAKILKFTVGSKEEINRSEYHFSKAFSFQISRKDREVLITGRGRSEGTQYLNFKTSNVAFDLIPEASDITTLDMSESTTGEMFSVCDITENVQSAADSWIILDAIVQFL